MSKSLNAIQYNYCLFIYLFKLSLYRVTPSVYNHCCSRRLCDIQGNIYLNITHILHDKIIQNYYKEL